MKFTLYRVTRSSREKVTDFSTNAMHKAMEFAIKLVTMAAVRRDAPDRFVFNGTTFLLEVEYAGKIGTKARAGQRDN